MMPVLMMGSVSPSGVAARSENEPYQIETRSWQSKFSLSPARGPA